MELIKTNYFLILQNLNQKAYATVSNYGSLKENVTIISSTKKNTIFKILRKGIYKIMADGYIQEGDVFLNIYKNGSFIAKQRTTTFGCISCNAILSCSPEDEIRLQCDGVGYEFNYSLCRVNDYE